MINGPVSYGPPPGYGGMSLDFMKAIESYTYRPPPGYMSMSSTTRLLFTSLGLLTPSQPEAPSARKRVDTKCAKQKAKKRARNKHGRK